MPFKGKMKFQSPEILHEMEMLLLFRCWLQHIEVQGRMFGLCKGPPERPVWVTALCFGGSSDCQCTSITTGHINLQSNFC